MDKIRLVAYQHDAMSCVFDKFTADRTLMKPRAKWVDAALFNVCNFMLMQAQDKLLIQQKSTPNLVLIFGTFKSFML